MASMTDPARELGEIAKRLTQGANAKGANLLADSFNVEPWSTSFYKIISCILERVEQVATIVQRSDMDDDHKLDAANHLEGFKSAFSGGTLVNSWNTSGYGLTLMKEHGQPIQFLSPTVRQFVAYPRLSDEEITELIGLIDRYREEIFTSSDAPPFVRQAILDGIDLFRFQLNNIGWMGAGYALSAFREVLNAYDHLQRHNMPDAFDPRPLLGGLLLIINKFKESVERAKSWTDAGEAVWRFYQVGSSFATPILITSRMGIS